MLTITVPGIESFDESTQEFVTINDVELELEHSLASLSKWESIFEKPFLTSDNKSEEETLGYIRCMTLSPNVSDETFSKLSSDNYTKINEYISSKMTATWFNETPEVTGPQKVVTAEIIYYWMMSLNVPLECEKWHLNRLLTLIKVINRQNAPAKKVPMREALARQHALNAQRQAQYNTKG